MAFLLLVIIFPFICTKFIDFRSTDILRDVWIKTSVVIYIQIHLGNRNVIKEKE